MKCGLGDGLPQLCNANLACSPHRSQGSKLLKDLEKEREGVEQCRAAAAGLGYDPTAAAGLEEQAEQLRGEVRRWKDRCDELSSQLAGEPGWRDGWLGSRRCDTVVNW